MELREYALGIVSRGQLAAKLEAPPADVTDEAPGPALRIAEPTRDPRIAIVDARKGRVPPVIGYQDKHQRARIIHALANHELQAAELFAWALLAYPDTPPAFRRGLLAILVEEQKHFRLYEERLTSLGHAFGDFPVTGHFWKRVDDLRAPLDFICAMGLTFENANLDFASEYQQAALSCGDEETARALQIVHDEEIRHVAFAWRWLDKLGPAGEDRWETFVSHLKPPLGPGRARGKIFDRESRVEAGLDEEFIDRLETATALHPSGRPR
mgnify:CR=1 FL=1